MSYELLTLTGLTGVGLAWLIGKRRSPCRYWRNLARSLRPRPTVTRVAAAA